ncbi:MAG TPA: hypothetical protein VEX15_12325 [Nocardioidaceae bacterium]|nr:hypothetical protein [Nocardioidaceae bacterium]
MNFDDLFLSEIRRQLPDDIDVVARPAPIEGRRRVDPRVARDDAEATDTLAVEALVELWRAMLPGESEPTALRLRWMPTQTTDAVGAEAGARCPGLAGVAVAALDRIAATLDAGEWSWTRRDPAGERIIRVLGRRHRVGFELGIRPEDDVVLLRTRVGPVVVGALGAELLERPIDQRPWPAS